MQFFNLLNQGRRKVQKVSLVQSKCLNRQYNLLFQHLKTPNYHQPYFAEGRRQFPDLGARILTNTKHDTLEKEAASPGQIRFKIIWSGMDNTVMTLMDMLEGIQLEDF